VPTNAPIKDLLLSALFKEEEAHAEFDLRSRLATQLGS
jgi:hypothetical protein